jgi:hypothetical protein
MACTTLPFRAAPYFECRYGTLMGSSLAAVVQPVVGATVAPGWKSAVEEMPEHPFAELMRQLRSDERDHIKHSWKLFPYMFLCRMAIPGPSETNSLASVLLSESLSKLGKPLYARERRIGSRDEAAP